jgi:hypothetical protein
VRVKIGDWQTAGSAGNGSSTGVVSSFITALGSAVLDGASK